jgi:hypothetical protein
MDKRGFGIIGAILAMVVAGLIVYGIIYYGPSILHGIQGGSGTTSLEDISYHPERYIGKEVTVEGYVVNVIQTPIFENEGYVMRYSGSVFQKDPIREAPPNYYLMLEFSPDNLGAGLITYAEYRLTGVVQNVTSLGMTLIVTQVEPT